MVHSGQLRHPTSKTIFWKWILGISVGATCAVLVIDGNRAVLSPIVAVRGLGDASQPFEATGTASAGGTTLTMASVELPAAPSAPAMLPPEKPLEKAQGTVIKPVKARAPAAANVAHFDSCLPSCETRDPQVAMPGSPIPPQMAILEHQAPVVPQPQVAILQSPAPVGPPPPLESALNDPVPMPPRQSPVDLAVDTGQALIEQAAGASNAVLDGTKRALGAAVDLVW